MGTRPGEKELADTFRYGGKQFDLIGLIVESFTDVDESAFSLGSEGGVQVVDIKQESSAGENNIQPGDIITEIGKTNISNAGDYKKELESYSKGDTIMLRILRNGNPQYVAFEIE